MTDPAAERAQNLRHRDFIAICGSLRREDLLDEGQKGENYCRLIVTQTPVYWQRGGIERGELWRILEEPAAKKIFSWKCTEQSFIRSYKKEKFLPIEIIRYLARELWDRGYIRRVLERNRDEGSMKEKDFDLGLHEVFARRLQASHKLLDGMGAEVEGYYQLWRPATSIPDRFVKGTMRLLHRKDRHVTYASTEQKYSDHPTGTIGLADREERYIGYLIPMNKDKCMLIGRAREGVGFRIIIFTILSRVHARSLSLADGKVQSQVKDIDRVFSMIGGTMGTADGQGFFAPIYIERIEEDKLDDHRKEMNLYKAEDIPDKVLAILQQKPSTVF